MKAVCSQNYIVEYKHRKSFPILISKSEFNGGSNRNFPKG